MPYRPATETIHWIEFHVTGSISGIAVHYSRKVQFREPAILHDYRAGKPYWLARAFTLRHARMEHGLAPSTSCGMLRIVPYDWSESIDTASQAFWNDPTNAAAFEARLADVWQSESI